MPTETALEYKPYYPELSEYPEAPQATPPQSVAIPVSAPLAPATQVNGEMQGLSSKVIRNGGLVIGTIVVADVLNMNGVFNPELSHDIAVGIFGAVTGAGTVLLANISAVKRTAGRVMQITSQIQPGPVKD